jgi:catechol 2,3-dioxygenase-like lactoylglutathione lyase family enzyme
MNAPLKKPIAAAKLQHHVIYVSDLNRSKDFYVKLFDLQFSALNHPDSSAAMRLSNQEMHFFSFGFYHHDLCLVKHHKLKMDNNSMLHFTLVAHEKGRLRPQLRAGTSQRRTAARRRRNRRQCRMLLLRSGLQQRRILRRYGHDRKLSRALWRHERFGPHLMWRILCRQ